MKRALIILALGLAFCAPSHATIAFVRTASATSVANANTLAITMTETAGNVALCFVTYDDGASVTPSGVSDNASTPNTWTMIDNAQENKNTSSWSTAVSGTLSATTITVTFPNTDTAEKTAICGDYSGALSLGTHHQTTSSTNTASSCTDSLTTQDSNNFVVAGCYARCGGACSMTALTGNLRGTLNNGAVNAEIGLNDNTSASAGSVTNAITIAAASNFAELSVELRTFAPTGNGGDKRRRYERFEVGS